MLWLARGKPPLLSKAEKISAHTSNTIVNAALPVRGVTDWTALRGHGALLILAIPSSLAYVGIGFNDLFMNFESG